MRNLSPILAALLASSVLGRIQVVGEQDSNCQCFTCALRRQATEGETTVDEISALAKIAKCHESLDDNGAAMSNDDAHEYDALAEKADELGYPALAEKARLYAQFIPQMREAAIAARAELDAKQEKAETETEANANTASEPVPATAG